MKNNMSILLPLNVSDINYLIVNNIREEVFLKNIIQTKGILGYKKRFAVLTTNRLVYFHNKEKFLNKKPHKVYL